MKLSWIGTKLRLQTSKAGMNLSKMELHERKLELKLETSRSLVRGGSKRKRLRRSCSWSEKRLELEMGDKLELERAKAETKLETEPWIEAGAGYGVTSWIRRYGDKRIRKSCS